MKKEKCSLCNTSTKKYQIIDEVLIVGSDEVRNYRVDLFKNLLDNWLSKKLYHLSATELILLRPDIVTNFVQELMKDTDAVWYGKANYICQSCYEYKWKKLYPLR